MAVMKELMRIQAEDLFGPITKHLGGRWIDDGDPAIKVDTVDAITDGLQHRVRLPYERSQLLFRAYLLGNIHTKGKHVLRPVARLDKAIAIRKHALLTGAAPEMEQALRFSLT